MNRTIKNVISFVIIFLMAAAILLTGHFLKPDTAQAQMPQMGQQMSQTQMPDNRDASMGEAPEKPDGDNDSMSEVPEKPDGENDSMEKPDGNTDNSMELPGEGGNPANAAPTGGNMEQASSGSSILYYILIAVESLIAAMMILYLVMSRCHRKNFRETFVNRDKIIIYILSIVILTTVLGVGSVKAFATLGSNPGAMQNESDVSYSAVKEITEDTSLTEGSFSSDATDENAILTSGNIQVSLSNLTVKKSGDSDGGDNSNFYGNNSAIIAKDQAALTLKNLTVTTDADGANGVFSYGGSATTDNTSSDGTAVTIQDSTITTSGDNAGGIMTTGGGIMNASNLTIKTSGTSSAAIRSDRGGGTVTVDGGTYTTTGAGSPAIYSTSETSVKNAKLVAKASEGAVIEGANSIDLENCTLTDNNTKLNGLSTTYKNVFLYQSMSGDADAGTASFTATDCKLTTKKGDSFYVTNTSASIVLSGNTITNTDSSGNFLRAQADSWGTEGSNGGNVTLTLDNQKVSGNIVIDSVSTLKMTMKSGSSFEGTINGDNDAKSIDLVLDADSSIKLTGDSYVTSLSDDDSTYSNIDFNGYTLYVNGNAIN